VRKAASVVPREMVANWLYGVAHQTALKARATSARRGAREKQVTAMPEPALEQPVAPDDLGPLLDQELSRLPDKFRAVIVLCDLEGKTRKEAARQLQVPEGTVASRQATARARLAQRLARHGRQLSGGRWPRRWRGRRRRQACRSRSRPPRSGPGLKIATAVLAALVVLGVGAAALTRHVQADSPATQPVVERPAEARAAEAGGGGPALGGREGQRADAAGRPRRRQGRQPADEQPHRCRAVSG
jgi:hypothetical protein